MRFEKGYRGARRCGPAIEDSVSDLESCMRRGGVRLERKVGFHSTLLSTLASFKRVGGCINLLPVMMPREEEIHRKISVLKGAGPEDMNWVGQSSGPLSQMVPNAFMTTHLIAFMGGHVLLNVGGGVFKITFGVHMGPIGPSLDWTPTMGSGGAVSVHGEPGVSHLFLDPNTRAQFWTMMEGDGVILNDAEAMGLGDQSAGTPGSSQHSALLVKLMGLEPFESGVTGHDATGGGGSGGSTMVARLAPTPDLVPVEVGQATGSISELKGPTRASLRLLSAATVPAMDRAKRRKAFLREGETDNPGNSVRKWNSIKIVSKSARCGVKLTVSEAEEFHNFLTQGL